jgi:proline iminopeptidase
MQEAVHKADQSGNYSDIDYQAAMMEFYRRHVCLLDPWPDYVNETFAKLGVAVYNHMWGPSEFKATGTLKNLELVEDLYKIKIPSIFICGEFDEATPETTSFYSSKLPGSEFHVIPGSSHMHHAEKEEEFLLIVKDFLTRFELK